MAINRLLWKNGFVSDKIPSWICPTCNNGTLKGDEERFRVEEDRVSKLYRKEEDWDPVFISGVFSGMLQCDNSNCMENVAVVGKMSVEEEPVYYNDSGDYDLVATTILTPELFRPPLEIFPINVNIPKDIRRQIIESFSIYWADSQSAANKIRGVVELIMNYYKIKHTSISKGKRVSISLHHRIDLFKKIHTREGDWLMAIKWIGNHGSHSSNVLTKDDILDGFEILELVLHKLYETETKRINELSKSINKKKRPIGKRK